MKVARLLDNATVADASWLLRVPELRDKVCVYSHSSHCVLSASDIPWPALWALARYNLKHILVRRLPALKKMHEAAVLFTRKEKWRWVFRNDASELPPFRVKSSVLREPNMIIAPELLQWSRQLIDCVTTAATVASRRSRLRHLNLSNTVRLTSLGFKLLKQLNVVVDRQDKVAGYVIKSLPDHIGAVEELLHSDRFVCVDEWPEVATSEYTDLVKGAALYHGKPEWIGLLCRSLYQRKALAVSELITTVKTHKDQGKITHRLISGHSAYPYAGLSMWLGRSYRERFNAEESQHCVERARDIRERVVLLPPTQTGYILYKLDVKDFFLKGKHNRLVGVLHGDSLNSIHAKSLRFLLHNQFIASRFTNGVYRVVEGFGMGRPHAGDAATLVFYLLVEKPWARLPSHALPL